MVQRFRLHGRLAVPVPAGETHGYCNPFEFTRTVAHSDIYGVRISTVFAGHTLGAVEPGEAPALFETAIITDAGYACFARCATWSEAQRQHAAALLQIMRVNATVDV